MSPGCSSVLRRGAWRRVPSAVLAALVGLGAAFLPVGCGSPERAPRQPISGVDRPWPEDGAEGEKDGEDQARVLRRETLDAFVADIIKAREGTKGPVAVFWPLTDSPLRSGDQQINGLGERVSLEIADALRASAITPIAGSTLVNDIKASGRCLNDLRTLDDVYWLAQKIGAVYVVYGTVNMREYHRLRGDRDLEVELFCKRLGDNTDVARLQRTFPPSRRQRVLYREFTRASDIAIGDAAVPCPPKPEKDASEKDSGDRVVPAAEPKTSCRLRSSRIAAGAAAERTNAPKIVG